MDGRLRLIALLNSYTEGVSGGDVRFIEIAKRLRERDLEIWVITSRQGKKICKKYGLKAEYILTTYEEKIKDVVYTYFKRIIKALLLKLKVKEGDILYSTSDFLPDVLPAFIWKLRNRKVKWVQVIHHLYETPLRRRGKNFLVNLLGFSSQRISFVMVKREADLVITVNPIVKWQLTKLGFNAQKIRTNYDGVDLTKMAKIKPSDKKYDCAFLGRLNVSKGIFDLVEIWKIVTSKIPNVSLAVIGGGDELAEQALKNKVKKDMLEKNIDILGYLEDREAFGILKSCKLFVFPSYEEGFGIAALEAMACGLPVVAYDLPVYQLFGDAIIKVPVGNKEVFAEAITKLLSNEKLRGELSEKAKKVASQFDWNKIAENEITILKDLIGRGKE